MGDSVFVNGRSAVHKKSNGKSVAFPDVCLCPPSPPAGPVPAPLTNTVVAGDLAGGASSVLIEGSPAGTRRSYFKKSTGNEISRPTGGGIMTGGVQGKAHFRFGHSFNVFFEGEPAVRHLDPVTHNHVGFPGNTPPAPWMSRMDPDLPRRPPKTLSKQARDGDDWLRVQFLDETGDPVAHVKFALRTPAGQAVQGKLLASGTLVLVEVAKGRCELTLPEVDHRMRELKRTAPPEAPPGALAYAPGRKLMLETGRAHTVVVPATKDLCIHLPVPVAHPSGTDRFVLRSDDGAYELALTAEHDRVRGDRGLTLEFPGLLPRGRYTLVHERGDGQRHEVFKDCRFEDLFAKDPGDSKELVDIVR